MPEQISIFVVSDNLVVSRSNLSYTHSPNVSRSWEPHDVVARVRTEERLARSFGDRGQEKKVLDWCKKHNVNVIRKLPKLDPTILVSKIKLWLELMALMSVLKIFSLRSSKDHL